VQISDYLKKNPYPGRGLAIGKSEDGRSAVLVYFIMGRSVNSRNRIFVKNGEGIRTQAFDPEKLSDPSLIIYDPVKVMKDMTVVSNGDQTDTVFSGLSNGLPFEKCLDGRTYEPDPPHYTPRITGLAIYENRTLRYKMSILKRDPEGTDRTLRLFWDYPETDAGFGSIIHTYLHDGNPLPSFEGDPESVEMPGNISSLTESVWNSLNRDNRISLFVRFVNLENGKTETEIRNANGS